MSKLVIQALACAALVMLFVSTASFVEAHPVLLILSVLSGWALGSWFADKNWFTWLLAVLGVACELYVSRQTFGNSGIWIVLGTFACALIITVQYHCNPEFRKRT